MCDNNEEIDREICDLGVNEMIEFELEVISNNRKLFPKR